MTPWSVAAILAGRKTQTRRPVSLRVAKSAGGLIQTPSWPKPIADGGSFLCVRETFRRTTFGVEYRADHIGDAVRKWKPARFMPHKHARLWLELTAEPRLERIDEINADDAIAEGVELPADMLSLWSVVGTGDAQVAAAALDSFRTLWDSIYRDQGHGFGPGQYVYVYTFRPHF